ncbi:MAG: Fe-S cluster assembly protein SufD [Bacteroidaceae bacterium]|nr:Fe-S cluster assembly protein SufD [Bacteroidaceae bacterium]
MKDISQYLELFRTERDLIDAHSVPALNALRDEAAAAFERMGFPSKKVERYRYTDVATAFAPNYGLNLSRLHIPVNPYEAFRCDIPNLSTSVYFVVNDSLYKDALPKATLPKGVIVDSLNALSMLDEVQAVHSPFSIFHSEDSLTALNSMLAQDALLIYIRAGVRAERPIQVVNILRSAVPLMVNRKVRIVAEAGAEVRLLFCDHAADDQDFLATQVMEVSVGEGAHVELYELEETHARCHRFANLYADVAAGGHLTHATLTLTNGLTRNQTDVCLSGKEASVNLLGCAITDGQQHVDNNTLIDHRAPGCTSRELYKYVVDEQSEGAFAGRILVREQAGQTESQETNANLVCTPEARIWTQPMLEIYADDVQCSHGSTVGQLNDEALFYMRQRGISESEARLLLKQAFASEVLNHITLEPLRDRLHYLIDKRFRGELNHCRTCRLCNKS